MKNKNSIGKYMYVKLCGLLGLLNKENGTVLTPEELLWCHENASTVSALQTMFKEGGFLSKYYKEYITAMQHAESLFRSQDIRRSMG